MKVITVVSALLGTAISALNQDVRRNLGGDKIVNINFEHLTDDTARMLKNHGADMFGKTKSGADFKLSEKAARELEAMGVRFEETTEQWVAHFDEIMQDENLICTESAEKCASRDAQGFYNDFQTYNAYISRVQNLVAGSSLATIRSPGTSYEGRDIYLVEIGDQSKPLAFVFCNVHAREWLTPMFCTYLIETLLDNGGHPLLDTFSFGIIPSGNPDGYIYSFNTNNLWRKTREPNPGSSCIGTDPNRNWNNNHCGVGSSTSPCDSNYCGRAPFDQQEVELLDNYVRSLNNRVITSLDIHSYGYDIIHPYGYTNVPPPEPDYTKMRTCARIAGDAAEDVSGDRWSVGTTPQVLGYTSGGTSKDYMYGNLGIIYSYTVEMRGTRFQPPTSEIPLANRETFALVEAMLNCIEDQELTPTAPPVPTIAPPPTPPPTSPPTDCFFFC